MTQELHGVISLGGTVIGGSLNQRGLKGETGDKGDKGDAATVTVGSTTTGAAGTSASVTNSGTQYAAVLDFTIPKGDKGDTGATGDVNTYIAEYGSATYAEIGSALSDGKYVIAQYNNDYYPLIMFSNSSYVFSYIHENICHEVVCDSYSTWTARTHTSVRDVKQNGASVTTSGVALVTTPQPTTTTPKMDGTAAVGSETTWAKGDHVHPPDTTKVDKEVGKGLSANDFTDSLKTKLEGVESGAEVNVQSDWNQSTNTADDYIKNKPDLSVYAPKEMIKNTLPTDTASGSIASFPDGSDLFDYLSCVVNITPVQDLHGYDKPWVGGAGKNLFSVDLITSLSNLSRNGETFTNTSADSRDYFSFFVQAYSDSTYIKQQGGAVSGTGRKSVTIELPSGITSLRIKHSGSSNDMTIVYPFTREGTFTVSLDVVSGNPSTVGGLEFKNIQIESGSSATSYAPYENLCPITGWTGCNVVVSPTEDAQDGTTYPVSWQTEAGTVYGGTVDVVSGVLTVDRAMVEYDGSSDESWAAGSNYPSLGQRSVAITLAEIKTAGNRENIISDKFKFHATSIGDFTQFTNIWWNTRNLEFAVEGITTVENWKTWLSSNPIRVVYSLATPQVIQLSKTTIQTLLGRNNVWADTGNTSVTYKADTQLWVEKQLREINTAILALS